jgi:hypothetical protein
MLRLTFETVQPDSSYIKDAIFQKIHYMLLLESIILSILAYLLSRYVYIRENTEKDKKIFELSYKIDRQGESISTFCETCMNERKKEICRLYKQLCDRLNEGKITDDENTIMNKLESNLCKQSGLTLTEEEKKLVIKLIKCKKHSGNLVKLYDDLRKKMYACNDENDKKVKEDIPPN